MWMAIWDVPEAVACGFKGGGRLMGGALAAKTDIITVERE